MFFVYIIESITNGSYYIGQTSDLEQRLKRHNKGQNISSRYGRPWKLLFWNEFNSRSEAVSVEQHLKKLKNRHAIFNYVQKNNFRGVAQPG